MFGKAIVRGVLAVAVLCCAVVAQANVFNMGPGLTSLETVPVGDPGNAADSRYDGYGSVGYDYQIGKCEVTAGQYTEFLNAVAKTDTYGLYNVNMADPTMMPPFHYSLGCNIQRTGSAGDYSYSVASDWANRPVNYVSLGDAARFANWLHNGQPTGAQSLSTTEDGAYYLNGATTVGALQAIARKTGWKWAVTSRDEWYKAAFYKRGSTNAGYWDYATRSDACPGRDTADASGNNANYSDTFTFPSSPIDSSYYTTVVGQFQNSASPYGTFDQDGNILEWTENIPPPQLGMLRGGAFNLPAYELPASASHLDAAPASEYYYLGFRVVSVPEPASIAMLAGVALTALLYWWRKRA